MPLEAHAVINLVNDPTIVTCGPNMNPNYENKIGFVRYTMEQIIHRQYNKGFHLTVKYFENEHIASTNVCGIKPGQKIKK